MEAYNGDCIEQIKGVEDNDIDLFDPPYGVEPPLMERLRDISWTEELTHD